MATQQAGASATLARNEEELNPNTENNKHQSGLEIESAINNPIKSKCERLSTLLTFISILILFIILALSLELFKTENWNIRASVSMGSIIIFMIITLSATTMYTKPNNTIYALSVRSVFIILVIFLSLIIFYIIFMYTTSSTGGMVTVSSALSGVSVIVIVAFDETNKAKLNCKSIGCMKILKSIFHKSKLLTPLISHLADTATDLGVLFDFYLLSTANDDNSSLYTYLFTISVIVVLFYRIVSAGVIYNFSDSIKFGILQFFDLYIFIVLQRAWNLHHSKAPIVQNYVDFLEAILESAPQLLITVYLTLNQEQNTSVLIWISLIISLLQLAERARKVDQKFFKSVEGPQKWLLLIISIIWRYADVSHYFLFLSLIWIQIHGAVTIICICVQFVIIVILLQVARRYGYLAELFMINGVLITLPNPYSNYLIDKLCVIVAASKNIIVFIGVCVLFIYKYDDYNYNIIMYITTCLYVINIVLWLVITTYFVDSRVSTTPFVSGCKSIHDVEEIIQFGYTITNPTVQNVSNWSRFPDPLELISFFQNKYQDEVDLKNLKNNKDETLVHWIVQNVKMGIKYDSNLDYFNRLLAKLNNDLEYSINYQSNEAKITPLMVAVQYQPNITLIRAMIEFGVDVNLKDSNDASIFDYAKLYNPKIAQELQNTIDQQKNTIT